MREVVGVILLGVLLIFAASAGTRSWPSSWSSSP
jgi:hypothetical protein